MRRRRGAGGDDGDAPVARALLEQPGLAPNVDVHRPDEKDAPWVVERGHREYIRVGKDLGCLLTELDGHRGHAELADRLGTPWTPEVVAKVVNDLHERGLLEDGSEQRRASGERWVKYVPPLTLQFTLLRPNRLLTFAAPAIHRLAGRVALGLAAIVAVAGVVALLAQGPAAGDALSEPLAPEVYVAVLAGFLVSTVLHEMAHGAALVRYGGRPSRMGFMFFYLSPAFFCDVSDAWRLPHGWQRVRIALAGIGMQTVVACLAAIVALAGSGGALSEDVRQGLLLFALAGLVAGVLNLVPLIKLDGYIALMSWLDVPHLRDRSMTDARRLVARGLFGGRYERELPELPWAPWYGLACMVFPGVVVAQALLIWVDLLSRVPFVGGLVLLFGAGYVLYAAGRGAGRVAREGRAARAPKWRIGSALALVAALAVTALAVISVPYRVAGGYVSEDGRTALVVPRTAGQSDIPTGARVALGTNGPVLHRTTGRARTTGDGRRTEAPAATLLPVRLEGDITTPVLRYPLSVRQKPDRPVGAATVDLGERRLGDWLYEKYVHPAIG